MATLSRQAIRALWILLLLVMGSAQATADSDSPEISITEPAPGVESIQPYAPSRPQDTRGLIPAYEHILSFDTHARMEPDGSMDVRENIKVLSLGREIRRGIFRTLPLTWYRQDGKIFSVDYQVSTVLRDGVPERFSLDKESKTLTVRIGSPESVLQPGVYNYEIHYQVSNHFSRFPDWDELYWNVTGNGWNYPISHASFQLELPGASNYLDSEGKDSRLRTIDLYTGAPGKKEQNARILPNGEVQTTQALGRGEGLTVVYTWPRDILANAADPKAASPLSHMFLPTLTTLVLWIPVLLLVVYCWRWWRQNVTAVGLKMPPVIPLYAMPDNMSPGYLRFISLRKYDDVAFTSDLLALVAKHCVAITYKDKKPKKDPSAAKMFSTEQQWLTYQPEKKNQPLTADDKHLLGLLFTGNRKNIDLSVAHQKPMQNARNWLESRHNKQRNSLFRKLGQPIFRAACIVWLIPLLCGVFFSPTIALLTIPGLIFLSFGIAMLLLLLMFLLSPKKMWMSWGCLPLILAPIFGPLCVFGGGVFLLTAAPLSQHPAGYMGALLVSILVCVCFAWKLPRYTKKGMNDLATAQGLKLYLGTAERHRYQTLYPPEQRVAHFESLLPAALALGVGQTWANTFAEYLSQSGAISEAFSHADWDSVNRFSYSCSSSSRDTPSASSGSGSSGSGSSSRGSGSSGGGSSGGGSGGGGGGGW